LQQIGDKADVEVRWRPFFIRPNFLSNPAFKQGVTPGECGTPAGAYWGWAIPKAQAYGLDMSGGVSKYSHILDAHRIMDWAEKTAGWQVQHVLAGLIFKAFYAESVFLGNENLARLAGDAGLDPRAALAYLNSRQGEAEVMHEYESYVQRKVDGAPCFFINDQKTFSGAQSPDAFVSAILRAAR